MAKRTLLGRAGLGNPSLIVICIGHPQLLLSSGLCQGIRCSNHRGGRVLPNLENLHALGHSKKSAGIRPQPIPPGTRGISAYLGKTARLVPATPYPDQGSGAGDGALPDEMDPIPRHSVLPSSPRFPGRGAGPVGGLETREADLT